jgi:hypothetical protein
VIAQKLNESLPDHSGRAKNANPASFHPLRITRGPNTVTHPQADQRKAQSVDQPKQGIKVTK